MELLLKRIARKQDYTIGRLYVNGTYFCDICEDRDRLFFGEPKVMHKTAIPCGRYEITLSIYSPKFGNKEPYKSTCNGCVPRLKNVPQFDGVLIHCGNTAEDSSGCLIVGLNKVVGKVVDSRKTWVSLMQRYFIPAKKKNEKVYITVI